MVCTFIACHLIGLLIFFSGAVILIAVIFGWFREVIREHSRVYIMIQTGRSFRWGMIWFIFSEVFFFGIFLAHFFIHEELLFQR